MSEDYKIKITKKSKYKRIDTWGEFSGELSGDEIAAVMYYDKIDTIQEKIKKSKANKKDQLIELDNHIANKKNIISGVKEKVNFYIKNN